MLPFRVSQIDPLAANVPISNYRNLSEFAPLHGAGASRYRTTFTGGQILDSLLVSKDSDVLVVSFHGALDRKKYSLPRFERLRALRCLDVSSFYIGDPALWMSDSLELAWYGGWAAVDLYPLLAEMIAKVADAVSARHVWVTGSSGGGLAALQVSALMAESVAIVYNAQTSVREYLHPQWPHMPQFRYVESVLPELGLDRVAVEGDGDWTRVLDDRLSAVRRYSSPRENRVVYVINENDSHHVDAHLRPFEDAIVERDRLQVVPYKGAAGHAPPPPAVFKSGLVVASDWCGASFK